MKGKCYYCGKEISRASVTKHLKSCLKKEEYQNKVKLERKRRKNLFLLQVSYKYNPDDYWMFISIDENSSLRELDIFLRDVWVECCGHLSVFKIEGIDYDVDVESANEYGLIFEKEYESMDVKIKNVLREGLTFSYEYDFGDTTHITIKVLGKQKGYQLSRIEIMARNNPKEYKCSKCGNKARFYCYECSNYYCEECIENDRSNCYHEIIYEIIEGQNSPRCGVCGYVYNEKGEDEYLPKIKSLF